MRIWMAHIELQPTPESDFFGPPWISGTAAAPGETARAAERRIHAKARRLKCRARISFLDVWDPAQHHQREKSFSKPAESPELDEEVRELMRHDLAVEKQLAEKASSTGEACFILEGPFPEDIRTDPLQTEEMREVLDRARLEASRRGHRHVHPEHLLYAAANQESGIVADSFRLLQTNLVKMNRLLEARMKYLEKSSSADVREPRFNPECFAIYESLGDIALEMETEWHGAEHLLLALIRAERSGAGKTLGQMNIGYDRAEEVVWTVLKGEAG